MVVSLESAVIDTIESAADPDGLAGPAGGRGKGRLFAGVALVAAVAGVIGWQAPQLADSLSKPPYMGKPASAVAADLGCDNYAQSTKHDESVYRFHDQGTCSLDGTIVTITTFDRASDEHAFESVMRALIPVVHPTWEGATYAAGEAWNVADARNLTPETATQVVRRLGTGATRIIPFPKS